MSKLALYFDGQYIRGKNSGTMFYSLSECAGVQDKGIVLPKVKEALTVALNLYTNSAPVPVFNLQALEKIKQCLDINSTLYKEVNKLLDECIKPLKLDTDIPF